MQIEAERTLSGTAVEAPVPVAAPAPPVRRRGRAKAEAEAEPAGTTAADGAAPEAVEEVEASDEVAAEEVDEDE